MAIELHNIIPSPLEELPMEDSQVWRRDISFLPGHDYLIYAESGKGKTTLINLIYGLRSDYQGNLLIDGRNSRDFTHRQRIALRREHFALVPQGLWLFEHLSGIENIRIKNNLTSYMDESGIQEYLKACGIADHQHKPAGLLSFGQKQRFAIIRSLCQPFRFLLLDEAFSHLDKSNKDIITDILKKEVRHRNAGMILTSLTDHEPGFDKIIRL
ncbi:MAG: ATP-binding cassette domain-containing protein [Bacteroidales bacterium]